MYNILMKTQILEDYNNNVPISVINEKYGVSYLTVYRWLKKNNIQARNIHPFKYNRNINYFTIPNNENSYWAGFIAADGHILKNKKSIQIKVSLKDLNHLMTFKNMCEYEGVIRTYDRTNGYLNNKYCALNIGAAEQWSNDLYNNFNILNGNKTFDLIFPRHLNNENKLSFIAGYIDGDGSISYYEENNKYILSVVSGSKDILIGIKEYFDEKYKAVHNRGFAKVRTKDNIYQYALEGKRFYNIIKDIKQLNVPLMSRKWCK